MKKDAKKSKLEIPKKVFLVFGWKYSLIFQMHFNFCYYTIFQIFIVLSVLSHA